MKNINMLPFVLVFTTVILRGTVALEGQDPGEERAVVRSVLDWITLFVERHGEGEETPHLVFDPELEMKDFGWEHEGSEEEMAGLIGSVGLLTRSVRTLRACPESRCRLPAGTVVFNIHPFEIDGYEAVVQVAWLHNAGMIRQNQRLMRLRKVKGEWAVAEILQCLRTTGGGPCW